MRLQRISRFQNSLLRRELKLKEQFRTLSLINRVDPPTNVGNLQFLEQQLGRYLEQHKGRNGHIGLLLCRIDNLHVYKEQHGDLFRNQLLRQACERLKATARPLDDVARINENTLALVLYGQETTFITHTLIRRVQDSLFTRAYSTSAGFNSLTGTLQYDIIDANGKTPQDATEVITGALDRLNALEEGQSIHFWEQSNDDAPEDEA